MNEETLVRLAQSGDMVAFEQLVFHHDKSVLSIAARYVASADEAKDIYQEVFLRVFRNLKKYRFRGEFGAWVHKITVNVCLTHTSRRREFVRPHQRESDEDNDGTSDGDPADPDVGPDIKTMNNEITERLGVAMQSLAPKHRMVFTLRHLEGRSLSEIAAMMECREGTIKRYLFDATRKIRELMKDFV